MQAFRNDHYACPEFVDDYRLLIVLTDQPRLLLIDTKQDMEGGIPVQTFFHLPSNLVTRESPSLFLESGVHKPSSTDYLTPFYQDPTQRIAVLRIFCRYPYLVFPVEALLELARDHEGHEIEWDGWKKHVALPSFLDNYIDFHLVSGCRFFRFRYEPDEAVEVYDFSIRGRVRHQNEQSDSYIGAVKCLQATARVKIPFPYRPNDIFVIGGGRESVVFHQVSALRLSHTARLNGALYVAT